VKVTNQNEQQSAAPFYVLLVVPVSNKGMCRVLMSPLELHDVFDAALYPQVPKCHSMVPSMTYVSNLHSRARKIPRTRFNPNHHDHDDKRLQTKL